MIEVAKYLRKYVALMEFAAGRCGRMDEIGLKPESVMFMCNTPEQIQDAFDLCQMLVGDQNVHWMAIPSCLRDNDPLRQNGYIGWELKADNKEPPHSPEQILQHMKDHSDA